MQHEVIQAVAYKTDNIVSNRVFGWCHCKITGWAYRLLYYKVQAIRQLKAQVGQLKILFYCSGFVSFMRGLHLRFCKRWRNYEV